MNFENKTALVTGGGAGIGLAITKALNAAGVHVIIAGRDKDRLERVRSELGNVTVFQADLAHPDGRIALMEAVSGLDRPLDILINNAGTMQYFLLHRDDAMQRMIDEFELDLHAPIHLSTVLLPQLLGRPEATIVNVTTGLIYAPFGNTPGYSAAKAGLHAFTQSLRWQTRGSGLKVIELMPPAVDTELTRRYDGPKTDAESVAKALIEGMRSGADEIRPGQTKALYAMSRIAPDFIYRTLNKAADKAPLDA